MNKPSTQQNRLKITLRVSIVNSCVNASLAMLKIIAGITGHSQSLIADGIHSFSDLITDALVYVAARLGGEHPDWNHPYGHRRIETIGSIIIALLLILVGVGIVMDSWSHLIHHSSPRPPFWPLLLVALTSIGGNEYLFRYTMNIGNQIDSDLLRSHAWHNRSDAFASVIVLISILGAISGLYYLDTIGASLIAILIIKIGGGMIWNALKELIDTSVDQETLSQITKTIEVIPGVEAIHQLRTRCHAGQIFVDVHIQVNSFISVSEGHYIADQVHYQLMQKFPKIIDIVVHIDPENDELVFASRELPPRPFIEKMLHNRWKDLPYIDKIQRIVIHYLSGKLQIQIILPNTLLDKYSIQEIHETTARPLKGWGELNTLEILFE